MTASLLRYTDVSLTDGQSARWAGAMTTPMMLAVATRLAAARPAAIEIASPATLQQCVARGENPWQRIGLLRERCPGIVLRAAVALLTEHGKRGADVISTEVATLWLRELAQPDAATNRADASAAFCFQFDYQSWRELELILAVAEECVSWRHDERPNASSIEPRLSA